MGMYDTFYGRFTCSVCGNKAEFEEPVTGFSETLEDYYLGDFCDSDDASYYCFINPRCPSCQRENIIALAIRNGQYAKVLPANEAGRTPVTDIGNIEESFERKRMYEGMCRELVGWEVAEGDAESYVAEKKPGDTIRTLRREWTVDASYDDPDERADWFYELFHMVNRSYRVHCGRTKRILNVCRKATPEVVVTVWKEE